MFRRRLLCLTFRCSLTRRQQSASPGRADLLHNRVTTQDEMSRRRGRRVRGQSTHLLYPVRTRWSEADHLLRPEGTGVVDGAGGRTQWQTRAAPLRGDDVGRDTHGSLLRSSRAKVESYRAREAGQARLVDTRLAEPDEPILVRPARAHYPDVGGRNAEGHLQERHIELGIVCQYCDHRPLIDSSVGVFLREISMGPVHYHLVGLGEAGPCCEDWTRVAHGHLVPEERADPRDRRCEINGTKHEESWRGRE